MRRGGSFDDVSKSMPEPMKKSRIIAAALGPRNSSDSEIPAGLIASWSGDNIRSKLFRNSNDGKKPRQSKWYGDNIRTESQRRFSRRLSVSDSDMNFYPETDLGGEESAMDFSMVDWSTEFSPRNSTNSKDSASLSPTSSSRDHWQRYPVLGRHGQLRPSILQHVPFTPVDISSVKTSFGSDKPAGGGKLTNIEEEFPGFKQASKDSLLNKSAAIASSTRQSPFDVSTGSGGDGGGPKKSPSSKKKRIVAVKVRKGTAALVTGGKSANGEALEGKLEQALRSSTAGSTKIRLVHRSRSSKDDASRSDGRRSRSRPRNHHDEDDNRSTGSKPRRRSKSRSKSRSRPGSESRLLALASRSPGAAAPSSPGTVQTAPVVSSSSTAAKSLLRSSSLPIKDDVDDGDDGKEDSGGEEKEEEDRNKSSSRGRKKTERTKSVDDVSSYLAQRARSKWRNLSRSRSTSRKDGSREKRSKSRSGKSGRRSQSVAASSRSKGRADDQSESLKDRSSRSLSRNPPRRSESEDDVLDAPPSPPQPTATPQISVKALAAAADMVTERRSPKRLTSSMSPTSGSRLSLRPRKRVYEVPACGVAADTTEHDAETDVNDETSIVDRYASRRQLHAVDPDEDNNRGFPRFDMDDGGDDDDDVAENDSKDKDESEKAEADAPRSRTSDRSRRLRSRSVDRDAVDTDRSTRSRGRSLGGKVARSNSNEDLRPVERSGGEFRSSKRRDKTPPRRSRSNHVRSRSSSVEDAAAAEPPDLRRHKSDRDKPRSRSAENYADPRRNKTDRHEEKRKRGTSRSHKDRSSRGRSSGRGKSDSHKKSISPCSSNDDDEDETIVTTVDEGRRDRPRGERSGSLSPPPAPTEDDDDNYIFDAQAPVQFSPPALPKAAISSSPSKVVKDSPVKQRLSAIFAARQAKNATISSLQKPSSEGSKTKSSIVRRFTLKKQSSGFDVQSNKTNATTSVTSGSQSPTGQRRTSIMNAIKYAFKVKSALGDVASIDSGSSDDMKLDDNSDARGSGGGNFRPPSCNVANREDESGPLPVPADIAINEAEIMSLSPVTTQLKPQKEVIDKAIIDAGISPAQLEILKEKGLHITENMM